MSNLIRGIISSPLSSLTKLLITPQHPPLAPNTLTTPQQPVRIILLLRRRQRRIIRAPERSLPVRLEGVRFVEIGARSGREGAHGGAFDVRDVVVRGCYPGLAGADRPVLDDDDVRRGVAPGGREAGDEGVVVCGFVGGDQVAEDERVFEGGL